MNDASAIELRRAGERFRTRTSWLDSRHSFSFGRHYDPANTHHGLLLVSNDDVVRAGTGFTTHPHRDMEIVTWVLEGELEHTDTTGHQVDTSLGSNHRNAGLAGSGAQPIVVGDDPVELVAQVEGAQVRLNRLA